MDAKTPANTEMKPYISYIFGFVGRRSARFRWHQGRFDSEQSPPPWAIDNVYIGSQCKEHCKGHGTCVNGVLCQCDDGYDREHCTSSAPNPNFLKEDFEGNTCS